RTAVSFSSSPLQPGTGVSMSELEATQAIVGDPGGGASPDAALVKTETAQSQGADLAAGTGDVFHDLAQQLQFHPNREAVLESVRTLDTQRAELAKQVEQFKGLEGWLPAITRLAEEYNATPDLVLDYLENPQAIQQTVQPRQT